MKTIYKIFNPSSGQYLDVLTKEECQTLLAKTAFDFYMDHVHGNPFTIVEINDDGSQTWKNAKLETIVNPTLALEEIENLTNV